MASCFVIQPFDHGPFDKRYDDVFAPAIIAAGLEPYRVDRDPSVVIPIEQIEEGLRNADACLADITTSNPNVWFELGFAIAIGRPVVLVCADEKDKRFPFDIQHRSIVTYKTESARDFKQLERDITARLQAAMRKENRLERLAESATLAEVEGLSSVEIVTLVSVAQSADGPGDEVSAWSIKHDLERSGFTRIAATLGITSLLRKRMLLAGKGEDQNGNAFAVYSVSDRGTEWLLANQEKLVLRQAEAASPPALTDDDIPF